MAHFLLSGMIVFVAGGFTCSGMLDQNDRRVAAGLLAALVTLAVFALTHLGSGDQYVVFDPICYVVGFVFTACVLDDEADVSDSPFRR